MVKDQILTSCPGSASHLLVALLGKSVTLLGPEKWHITKPSPFLGYLIGLT